MKIDFSGLARGALAHLPSLVEEWLPGGSKSGNEYKAASKASGGPGDSLSVNLSTGAWAHFSGGASGGDAISLYAYLFTSGDQGKAARELAERIGYQVSIHRPESQAEPPAKAKKRAEWTPAPFSDPAPPPFRLSHQHYGTPEQVWTYYGRGDLLGFVLGVVCRFNKADGGKEILPACWAVNGAGERAWRWLSFAKPRPLYNLPALDEHPAAPVLLVEGEKTADAAVTLFPMLAVLTWPGGSKAVKHADWSVLAGRQVLVWPDADPPGHAAAEAIAGVLQGVAKSVRFITPPADVPEGWDLADALAEGWTPDRAQAHAREHLIRPAPPAAEQKHSDPSGAGAGSGGNHGSADRDAEAWRDAVPWVYAGRGLRDCRENAIYLLTHHPEWKGVLAADTFAKRIVVTRTSPIGQQAGDEWGEQDDTALGLWLQQQEHLPMRSLETIAHAVRFVSAQAAVHPVRDYLEALEWDQKARVDTWAVKYLGAADKAYTRLVGRFFLINLVRRIFEPGCVMRSVPVLEGAQNVGKSRSLRVLAQPWFSDTQFKVGDKDAYMAIRGCWLYEISELESFNRAEATAVKAFISSQEDNFRAPYERSNTKHRRETMFAATTNAGEYLKDWTGNTRFWPLAVGDVVMLEELAAVRDQLLAEAVALYRQGERTYPTLEQERDLFRPEQELRMISHPWMDAIDDYLGKGTFLSVSVADVISECLGIKLDKINPQGTEAQRVGQILKALGWTKQRASSDDGGRGWKWVRPAAAQSSEKVGSRKPDGVASPSATDGAGGEDFDVPF